MDLVDERYSWRNSECRLARILFLCIISENGPIDNQNRQRSQDNIMQDKFRFHRGERAVPAGAGESAMAERNDSVIADTILGGARPFIARQFMVVLASVDAHGAVWSSVLYGQPGFIHADSATVVTIDVPAERRADSDPFWDNIRVNPAVGMLFIEFGTRRRYRINGTIERNDGAGIALLVGEAYPDCPKFIRRRHLKARRAFDDADGVATGVSIGGSVGALIRAADTVFVASNNATTGADASHRAGNPGFIQVTGERTLRIPDNAGNSLLNSVGNFETDPHVGLCMPDFDGQRLLQISGTARVLWNQPDPDNLTGGTGRCWEIEIARWALRQVPQRLAWEYLDASPFNLPSANA